MFNQCNYSDVYSSQFYFPISKGKTEVTISCTEWAVLYPQADVAQGIACWGLDTDVTTTFELFENTELILENYMSRDEVSYWCITLSEATPDNKNLFSTVETMQEFYIAQAVFIIIFLIWIFLNKFLWKR